MGLISDQGSRPDNSGIPNTDKGTKQQDTNGKLPIQVVTNEEVDHREPSTRNTAENHTNNKVMEQHNILRKEANDILDD